VELDPADWDVDFESLVTDSRRERWTRAAEAAGEELEDWVLGSPEEMAETILRLGGYAQGGGDCKRIANERGETRRTGRTSLG
jgi:hypothetical protein